VQIAFLAAAGMMVMAYWVRLPLVAGAAFYLFFAVEYDLRCSRIPNWLNAFGLLGALSAGFILDGGEGFQNACLGALAGLVPGFTLYAVGLLGAGDAKGIAVLGALLGPKAVPGLYMYMLATGAILSIALLAYRGELRDFLVRWGQSIRSLVVLRKLHHQQPTPGSAAAGGIPFAVCMALGSLCHVLGVAHS
jgi:prepilin peptidase CpaA